MRKAISLITLLGVAVAILGVATPRLSADNGPQTVNQSVTVPASGSSGSAPTIVDTGFDLQAGLPITVAASGSTDFCYGSCPSGPNGVNDCGDSRAFLVASPCTGPNGGYPGALAGKVGSGPWFYIGAGSTVAGSGRLYLAYVDCTGDSCYSDNSGSYTATLTYTCYSGNGYGDVNHNHCGPPGQNG